MNPEYGPYRPGHPLLRAIAIIIASAVAGVAALLGAAWLWPAQVTGAALWFDSVNIGRVPAGVIIMAAILLYLLYRLARAGRS